ncbi:MAG: methylmalonyl-CoA epimerase [Chitinophagaceae bacterium]|nr:methylmalonyl-CoA epimerase [Anaerolineae bacterium]
MMPIKVNHIAVVVEDVDAALNFWRDIFGLLLHHRERNEEEGVEIAFLPVGESEIELIAPITDDSGVGRYLAKKGAGLHHICIEVGAIATVIERLREKGAELINDAPKVRPDGTKYIFVHPKSTGGVLLELYELPVR